jgi:DNA-directed RNA polymerase specialized sigma24 family protein
MENAGGYLYRVAQSKSRSRRHGFLVWRGDDAIPDVEPALLDALRALAPAQLRAVWLVHGCGWSHVEVATPLAISPSTVATHVGRALVHLRTALGVHGNA